MPTVGDRTVASDYSGRTLEGKYELVKKLGEGGMGSVYLGRHLIIGRKVAVKFLHRDLAQSQEVVARFYREAQAAAEIGHRSIIEVMDVGTSPDGEPFIVMEYLEGESLASLLARQGALDIGAACGIMESVLLGLAAAHEKGIVHRDMKPENIFLSARLGEPPAVKIIDFGISKITREGASFKLTQTGSLLGTPSYMSPEQARGESSVDLRSDLYSMGVVLYEMLTGKLPIVAENYNQLILKVLTEEPTQPKQANPAFPAEAEGLVLRALAKKREERFQSALEMLEALKKVSAFGARHDRLTLIATGLKKKSLATGDLGMDAGQGFISGIGTPSEKSALASGGITSTPKAWSLAPSAIRASTPLKYALIGLGGLFALAVVLVAGIKGFSGSATPSSRRGSSPPSYLAPAARPAEPQAESASPPARPAGETVSIRILGAPANAKIYFDNAPVGDNPFFVRKEAVFLPLRVEAEGFETYQGRVLAERDQEVKVELRPIATAVAQPSGARPRSVPEVKKAARPASAAAAPTPTPLLAPAAVETGPTNKFRKGGRGTNVAENFE